MNQKFVQLIEYFKNYKFISDNNLQFDQSESRKQQCCKNIQNLLEDAIINGKTLIDLYNQKFDEISCQNQILVQQIQHLKQHSGEQKKQTDKLLQTSREIIEELRKELIQKDQQNQALTQKIQLLEASRADDLSFYSKQQTEQAYVFLQKIDEQKQRSQEIIKKISSELQFQISQNQQLQAENTKLAQQLEDLAQENQKLVKMLAQHKQFSEERIDIEKNDEKDDQKDASFQINSDFYMSNILKNDNLYQIYDGTQYQSSQDGILNESYEGRTALKDVLNYSDCQQARFNLTRQKLRTKQKQNMNDNFIMINNTDSYKKVILNGQNAIFGSKHSSGKMIRMIRDVKQFTMEENADINADPYFAFFTLTAQCIKINSQYFQEIAEIDIVSKQWNHVLQNRIPMNLWAKHLEKAILNSAGIQKQLVTSQIHC